jgi:hypothetical protein
MCEQMSKSLHDGLDSIERFGTAKLLTPLVGFDRSLTDQKVDDTYTNSTHSSSTHEGKIGFIVHPDTAKDYALFDSSLVSFTDKEMADLAERLGFLLEPFVLLETKEGSADSVLNLNVYRHYNLLTAHDRPTTSDGRPNCLC